MKNEIYSNLVLLLLILFSIVIGIVLAFLLAYGSEVIAFIKTKIEDNRIKESYKIRDRMKNEMKINCKELKSLFLAIDIAGYEKIYNFVDNSNLINITIDNASEEFLNKIGGSCNLYFRVNKLNRFLIKRFLKRYHDTRGKEKYQNLITSLYESIVESNNKGNKNG